MTEGTLGGRRRIVVGVDGSAPADLALRWALRQAVLTGADLEVLACWQRPVIASGYAPTAWVDFDFTKETERAASDQLASAVAETPGTDKVTVRTRVVEGYPAVVLTGAARGAELLVVGSRGHGEMAGLLLGSVGLHCAMHGPCSVVIVRP